MTHRISESMSIDLLKLRDQLGDSHSVSFEDGQIYIWNKGTQGVSNQMVGRIDKDGKITIQPGNEWIKGKILQSQSEEKVGK